MSSDGEQGPSPWERFKALPAQEQQVIEALKGVESQQQVIRFQYHLELLKLKEKYAGLLEPLYQRRKVLIAGESKPRDNELEAGEKGLRKVLGKEFQPPTRHLGESAGIANFWLATWMNHPGLSMIIAERDVKALEFLVDIRCTYFAGPSAEPVRPSGQISYARATSGSNGTSQALTTLSSLNESGDDIGYKLTFVFKANPFFENRELDKTYYYKQNELDEFGELLYLKSVGCSIQWKYGQDLIVDKDTASSDESSVSFFTFFAPRSLPPEAEVTALSDEEYSTILDEIEGDFECGEDIRDEMIPYSLTYLLDPPEVDEDSDDEDEEDDDD